MDLGPLIALLKRIEGLVRRYGTMQALCTFQETPKIVVTQEIHIIHGGYPGNIAGNAGNTGKFRHGFPACRIFPAPCRKIPEWLSGMPENSGMTFRHAGKFRHNAGKFRNAFPACRIVPAPFRQHAGKIKKKFFPECRLSGMLERVFRHAGTVSGMQESSGTFPERCAECP